MRVIGPVAPEAIERAVKEVGICVALGHPAIGPAEAFAAGEDLGFAVPERDGATLEQLFVRQQQSGRPLATAAIWHVAKELASALAATNYASVDDELITICHGFLSPEWVWLGWDGSVSLDGLGLAAVADSPGLRGSAGYDAPERRRAGKPTPRGDLYSLGAIVWALLTGDAPPLSPSAAELDDRVPAALRGILLKAVEPALGKRTLNVTELEQAFAAASLDAGKKELAAALLVLRKGTTMLGTARAPLPASSPSVSASSAAVTQPPAAPAPKPVLTPRAALPGAVATLPGAVATPPGAVATPRLGTPLPASVTASPVRAGSPLGSRLPPARAKLGSSSGAAADSTDPSPPVSSAGAPVLAPPRPRLGSTPPQTASRPRLPSIAPELRPSRPAMPIDEELSWGKASTDELASALDSALLDDLKAPESDARVASTQPSRTSDEPPPSLDSVRAAELPGPSSVRAAAAVAESAISGGPPFEAPQASEARQSLEERPASEARPALSTAKEVAAKPLSVAKAFALALGTAGLVFGVGAWWMTRQQQLPRPPEVSDLDAPAASDTVPAAPSTTSVPSPSSTAAASASAPSTESPATSASAAMSASAPGIDPATLTAKQGLLVVHFAGDPSAEVFFFANALGKVEQPLVVSCEKSLFLRVGVRAKLTDSPRWLSDGKPYGITCRALNDVTLVAKP